MSDAQNHVQIEYFVSKGDQTLGPWTINEIAERLQRSEISVTDFIFVEGREEWIPLMECEPLREKLRAKKPKAPPPSKGTATTDPNEATRKAIAEAEAEVKEVAARPESEALAKAFSTRKPGAAAETPTDESAEWFVQKGNNRYGPFTYYGLVRALQEKSIYEFDYVWKAGMEQWIRIAEHEAFAPEKIRELRDKTAGETGVFFRRQHPRIPFESEVIVHDNRSVWMGKAFEGSVGGSGLVIENATLVPGQVVLLHFAERDGLPSFNALCEIVSKKFQRDVKDTKAPVSYGVRFIKLDSSAEPQIQEYFRKKATDAPRAMNS